MKKKFISKHNNLKLAALLVTSAFGGFSTSASAVDITVNISKSKVVNTIKTVLNPKIRFNTHGPRTYKGRSEGYSYYKPNDSYITIAGSKKSIPIPGPVLKLYQKKIGGGKRLWRVWRAYVNDINLGKFQVSSDSGRKIKFHVEMESSGPEIRVHCFRRTARKSTRFKKHCLLKGLSPDVHFDKTYLTFKVAPEVRNGSLSYSNITNVKFSTKFRMNKLCRVAQKFCNKVSSFISSYVTNRIKNDVVSKINKAKNKDKVANSMRTLIGSKVKFSGNWRVIRIVNKSSYYAVTVRGPITKFSLAKATLSLTNKNIALNCPGFVKFTAGITTIEKLKGKLWILSKGNKKSKVIRWRINANKIKTTKSPIKLYYRLPTSSKYNSKLRWSKLVVQWSDGKGKTFTRQSAKVNYRVRCRKSNGAKIRF